jgi:Zn-dependent M28 family amino/carboxypeptidase
MDHLGHGPNPNNPTYTIYNGADDDGSGTVAIALIAEALARLPEPPRRSLLIVHVSG